MGRKYVCQTLEPERANLGEHSAFIRNRLAHDNVECTHPVTGHQKQMLVVDLVDLPHLAFAKQWKREPALHQGGLGQLHTTTSAASASAASGLALLSKGWRYSSTNSETC